MTTFYSDTPEISLPVTPLIRMACAVPNVKIAYILTPEMKTPEMRTPLSNRDAFLPKGSPYSKYARGMQHCDLSWLTSVAHTTSEH